MQTHSHCIIFRLHRQRAGKLILIKQFYKIINIAHRTVEGLSHTRFKIVGMTSIQLPKEGVVIADQTTPSPYLTLYSLLLQLFLRRETVRNILQLILKHLCVFTCVCVCVCRGKMCVCACMCVEERCVILNLCVCSLASQPVCHE